MSLAGEHKQLNAYHKCGTTNSCICLTLDPSSVPVLQEQKNLPCSPLRKFPPPVVRPSVPPGAPPIMSRAKGIICTFLGALIGAPQGVFIRFLDHHGAWTTLLWRSVPYLLVLALAWWWPWCGRSGRSEGWIPKESRAKSLAAFDKLAWLASLFLASQVGAFFM